MPGVNAIRKRPSAPVSTAATGPAAFATITCVVSGYFGQPASVTTGHRVVTVVPSTPLAPCADGSDADVEAVDGVAGVDGAAVDVGSALALIVASIAVGGLAEPAQPLRTRAAATQTRQG